MLVTTLRRFGVRVMSLVLALTAIAVIETTVAQPARAGTCGDYVRLYQSPLIGPVTDDWIGTDAHVGETVDVSRFEPNHYIAPHGNNLKAFTAVTYTFTPMDGRNLTPRSFSVAVQYNGVLRDDSFRADVAQFNIETTLWLVSVGWQACGGAYNQNIGFLQVTSNVTF